MKIGVHQIVKNANASSYFVQRSYGNYLVYSDALTATNTDFFKSKGGVYRQFIQKVEHISLEQVQLFKRFGAAAVTLSSLEAAPFSPHIKIELFSDDFVDPTVKFGHVKWGGSMIHMKQGDEKVTFVSPEYYYKSNGEVICEAKDCSEELFESLDGQGVSWVFFSEHDENCHYVQI